MERQQFPESYANYLSCLFIYLFFIVVSKFKIIATTIYQNIVAAVCSYSCTAIAFMIVKEKKSLL